MRKLYTGLVHPCVLENLTVPYCGRAVTLREVGRVDRDKGRTLLVYPYEEHMANAISEAIRASDLAVIPIRSGDIIRVAFPLVTRQRHRKLTIVLRREAEDARVAVRRVQQDLVSEIEEQVKDGLIAPDELVGARGEVQALGDQHVADIDLLLAAKEMEILRSMVGCNGIGSPRIRDRRASACDSQ